jgi:hypothetical protein
MIRIEFSPQKQFADRISQTVWFRNLGSVDCVHSTENGIFRLETKDLILECCGGESISFTSGWIRLRGTETVWHFGESLPNLKGTARTLDGISGRTFWKTESFPVREWLFWTIPNLY